MGVHELLQAKRDEIKIAAKHGAYNVRVFGSVARGDARPDSDVDLLVRFDDDRSLLDHGALVVDLKSLLDRKVDVADEEGPYRHLRDTILNEAKPI